MLDWRIAGASFAALIVVSSVFIGGSSFGIGDFFSDIMEQIGGWMKDSPFGGFFSTPVTSTTRVSMTLFSDTLEFSPSNEANITTISGANITGFSGTVTADLPGETVLLTEPGTPLRISLPLDRLEFAELEMASLLLENTGFLIDPNMTTDNGTVEITGFLGTGTLTTKGLKIEGNVSRLRTIIGGMTWELT